MSLETFDVIEVYHSFAYDGINPFHKRVAVSLTLRAGTEHSR